MPNSEYLTWFLAGILALLIFVAIALQQNRRLLVVTVLLSLFSLLMAIAYTAMGAPDVAMTEAAIGAGMSTVLLIAALIMCGNEEKRSQINWVALFVVVITGCALLYSFSDLPVFGSSASPAQTHLGAYYIERSGDKMGFPNMVTAILASYRGFDTLGETFVIFTAGIAIALLFQKAPQSK